MKIYQDLFKNIVSIENLLEAWNKFKKGKGEKIDVQSFEFHLEDNLFRLQRDLIHKKYQHSSYIGFYIRDPKVRRIHKAKVQDRVVHHALFRCLSPIFEPTFISRSFSARIKKGTHKAVKELEIIMRKIEQTHGCCFVLKCDIRKFFDSLDHEILLNIISKRIKDPDALRLTRIIIKSFSSGFNKNGKSKGLPLGNLTSQLFANIYLNELDQFIKHKLKIKYYIRYTDDFIIAHQNKNYLLIIKEEISIFLKTMLKLSLHHRKIQIRKYKQGVDFLGYVTLPKARILRTKTKRRIFRKLKQRVQQFKNDEIEEKTLIQCFNSYLGVLSHANTYGLKQKIQHKLWEWLKEPF